MVLNPWDVQGKRIYTTDGVSICVSAGMGEGGSKILILVKEKDGREADLPKNQKGEESDRL